MVVVLLAVSCTKEAYDTGDSALSYLKAEMANLHVTGNQVTDIVTDADEALEVPSSLKVTDKMARTDTTYRAMLYYNKVEGKPVDVKSVKLAYVTSICDRKKAYTLAQDPVKLTSVWKAQNNKYLNFSIGLMTGNAENEDAAQKMSLVCDSTEVGGDGSKCFYLTFYHDQANVPEYYTQDTYISVPLSAFSEGDILRIRMNTYNGWVEKEFVK